MPRKSAIRTTSIATPPVAEPVAPAPVAMRKRTTPVVWVLGALLAGALSAAGYFYWQYQNAKPGVAEAKEIESLTGTLGSMMYLPDGEEPTLATVTDKEKLADQPFFQHAENGDKVLIYSGSGRAILYRPSVKKIVDVTTVNVQVPNNTETTPTATPAVAGATTSVPTSSPTPAIVRVALYNGSTIIGVTNSLENVIRNAVPNSAVVSKDTAAKNDYPTTTVIDLSGTNTESAQAIASAVQGQIGSLPAGEKAPSDADVLVIVGNDR